MVGELNLKAKGGGEEGGEGEEGREGVSLNPAGLISIMLVLLAKAFNYLTKASLLPSVQPSSPPPLPPLPSPLRQCGLASNPSFLLQFLPIPHQPLAPPAPTTSSFSPSLLLFSTIPWIFLSPPALFLSPFLNLFFTITHTFQRTLWPFI